MNTKNVPAIITLAAGLIAMIAMIIMKKTGDMLQMVVTLFVVLLVFCIIGYIVKAILDANFKEVEEEEQEEESEESDEKENIDVKQE